MEIRYLIPGCTPSGQILSAELMPGSKARRQPLLLGSRAGEDTVCPVFSSAVSVAAAQPGCVL